jgi:alpha-1,6-mannosyltransferase
LVPPTLPRLPRRTVARIAEATTETLALAALVVGCGGFALAAAERPSFLAPPTLHGGDPSWLAGPLAGRWPSLSHAVGSLQWNASLALLALCAVWLVAVACARRVGVAPVLTAVALAVGVLTLAPPFSLTDTFNYLHYGRMQPLYGLDPYVHLPLEARTDPAYAFTTWHHLRSPYGPLFTLGLEGLAGLDLPTAYWTLKIAVGVGALAVAVLVALLARDMGRDPATAVAFTMLNPLVLVYGVGGVHNDVFVLGLMLGGALLARRRGAAASALGGSAWAAAVAIKLSAGLALPFLLIGARRRVPAAAGLLAGGAGAALLAALAFGGHLPNDAQQSQLVMGLSPANLLGLSIGHGGLDPGLHRDLEVVLVAGTAALAAWAWWSRDWAAGAAWAAALLLVTLGWVMPWYVLWVLPFAALTRRGAPRAAAIALTVFLLLAWAPATPPALHRMGAHITATATGRVNNRFLHALLR